MGWMTSALHLAADEPPAPSGRASVQVGLGQRVPGEAPLTVRLMDVSCVRRPLRQSKPYGARQSTPSVHGRRDPFFPVGNGEALAREIPGARLLVLERAATAIPDALAGEVAAAMLAL